MYIQPSFLSTHQDESSLHLGPLNDDELAYLCLDEEDDVEEDARQDGGDHGPDGQVDLVTRGRDQPVSRRVVRHLVILL